MKVLIPALLLLTCSLTFAGSRISPEMQATVEAQRKIVIGWAAEPVIIKAVKAQNAKGPIAGMDNAKWKAMPDDDSVVQSFQKSKAGVFLTRQLKASNGVITEAFLSAAQGEEVAFVQKPTSYNHKGMPKFDVPMTGKVWEGKPELDASSHKSQIQIGIPVLSGSKPIGVLVVGIAVKKS